MNSYIPTHLSLFSGIGGLDLAAEAAGFRTVGQCEWADYPTKVLEKHWPEVPRWKDIRTLTKESFYERTGLRTIELISGGFPCQPFSCAGKRRGKDDDRYLWPEMLRVINELRPTWVVGENVANIVNMALDQVLSDLEDQGYQTRTFIIPACSVDAPHRRDRCAIVAYSDSVGLEMQRSKQPPAGTAGSGKDVADTKLLQGQHGYITEEVGRRTGQAEQAGMGGRFVAHATGEQGWRLQQSELSPHIGAGCKRRHGLVANTYRPMRDRGVPDSDQARGPGFTDGRKDVSDTHDGGGSLRRDGELPATQGSGGIWSDHGGGAPEYGGWEWWPAEPDVGRVAHGIPSRVDRLKCLGNAVVPAQFFPVFQAIYHVFYEEAQL